MDKRLYLLDLLRGIGAISVLFWHWPNFLKSEGEYLNGLQDVDLPFYGFFSFMYNQGWLGVHLFFVLSGMVFYLLYSDKIAAGVESAYRFFVKRFSRLYPLAILTTVYAMIIQAILVHVSATEFLFPANNITNFVINILLLQAWGVGGWGAFNANLWSVSVELFLYIIFFLNCRYNKLMTALLLVLFAATAFFQGRFLHFNLINYYILVGLFGFFSGGVASSIYLKIKQSESIKLWKIILIILNIFIWWFVFVFYDKIDRPVYVFYLSVIVFPAGILLMALLEAKSKLLIEFSEYIGNISYSFYLIHYPLQLTFLAVTTVLGYSRSVYCHPLMFFFFILVLFVLSTLSFYRFERPIQNLLRNKFSNNLFQR